MPTLSRYTRLRAAFLFYAIFFLFLTLRLAYVQIIRYPRFSGLARRQHDLIIKLEPIRGAVYDRNMRELAFSINLESIYANPRMIKDPLGAAGRLAPVLGVDKDFLVRRFAKDKAFVWLKRKVSPGLADKVRAQGLDFIGFIKEPKRFYPNQNMACHVIGFAGLDNAGLEGIEMLCDEYLAGKPGWRFTKQDAKRRELPSYKNRSIPPINGYNVILTIDSIIQSAAEMQLDVIWRKFHPKGATIIVMEPSTGRILALANRPAFIPNQFEGSPAAARRNRAITDIFEPGSVFKAITASAALQEGKASPSSRFFCENGEYRVLPSYVLHDFHPYGWLTLKQVIEKSSNIGIGKIAKLIGPQVLHNYIKAYGFGKKTNIELKGEVSGMLRPVLKWSKTSPWNIPMGQEVAVTPIQLVCAFGAIANNGVLMKPYIIDRIQDSRGNVIESFSPVVARRVISEKTAKQMQNILAAVVESGTGTAAKIPGYSAAGKTGTAQKVEPGGFYSKEKYVGSFVGFAPAEDAMLACVVTVDEPQPIHFGAVVAAPAFSEVVGQSIEYLKAQAVTAPKPLSN